MAKAELKIDLSLADLPLVKDMAIAIAEVRLIHARNERFPYFCVNCRAPYPCRTVQVLDGPAVGPAGSAHGAPDWRDE